MTESEDRTPRHWTSDGRGFWWYPWPITSETVTQVDAGDIVEDLSGFGNHGMVYDHALSIDDLNRMAKDPLGMFLKTRMPKLLPQ